VAAAHAPIVVQAASATSTRRPGESNSFNSIAIQPRQIEVRRYVRQTIARRFESTHSEQYERIPICTVRTHTRARSVEDIGKG
jgi:hypothetical protein